jgi:hypothetical protein
MHKNREQLIEQVKRLPNLDTELNTFSNKLLVLCSHNKLNLHFSKNSRFLLGYGRFLPYINLALRLSMNAKFKFRLHLVLLAVRISDSP